MAGFPRTGRRMAGAALRHIQQGQGNLGQWSTRKGFRARKGGKGQRALPAHGPKLGLLLRMQHRGNHRKPLSQSPLALHRR